MKHLQLVNRTAKLVNLNTRIEKHGDDDVVRADLNFVTTIRCEDIVKLALTEDTALAIDRWKDLLYITTQDLGGPLQRLREHCLQSIKFNRDFEEHQLAIDTPDARMKFTGVRFCKFVVELDYQDHSLRLHFQAQIDPSGFLDQIAEALGRSVTIYAEPPSEDAQQDIEKVEAKEKEKPKAKRGRAFPQALDGTESSPLN